MCERFVAKSHYGVSPSAETVNATCHFFAGIVRPSRGMTSLRSDHAFGFSSGLRSRYAGWKVGMSGMGSPMRELPLG